MKKQNYYEVENIDGHLYKKCTTCSELKLISDFSINHASRTGVAPACRKCRADYDKNRHKENPKIKREERYKREYNLSIEEVEKLKIEQNNLCAICKEPMDGYRKMHVDHDKNTGQIRGLLCPHCNTGLGQFRHNVINLSNAITYLVTSKMKIEKI